MILLAVAHGSPDGSAAPALETLVDRVRERLPTIEVRLAWLDHGVPSLPEAVAALDGPALVVPLLLSRGYHSSVDIPAGAGALQVAPVLGPDPALAAVLRQRLRAAGVEDDVPVLLAAAGTSDPGGQQDVRDTAAALQALRGGEVLATYATAAEPRLADVRDGRPVAAYVLAPGVFTDRLDAVTGPLWDAPEVAELIVRRYLALARGR